jgi:Putative addiction module component
MRLWFRAGVKSDDPAAAERSGGAGAEGLTMATVDELFAQAMMLSAAEREELMDRLHLSLLPEVPGEEVTPEEAEQSWIEEIKRRSDELHEGKAQTMDAFEALEQLRRELYEENKKRRQS